MNIGRRGFVGAVVVWCGVLWACACSGCAPNSEAIERQVTLVMERVVIPVAEKAMQEVTTQTATLQGGAQVIEPGWQCQLEGFWVTGFKGTATVQAIGVSGQLTGHAQGAREPTTQPAGE